MLLSADHPVLVAAARHRLPASLCTAGAPVVLAAGEADAVRMFCRTDRISGLLAGAVRSGEVVADVETAEMVAGDVHDAMRACVLIESLLVRVAERLDRAGVRWAVTKGAAVAHSDYPDLLLRSFADVDVVVHPDDWSPVLAELAGVLPARSSVRAFTDRFGKGETVLVDDMEVDLHRRFSVGRFGVRCRMGEVFDRLDTIRLAGRSIPVLSAEYRLLHACFHAALGGNPGLRAWRDVAQIAAARPDALPGLWDVAARWRVEPVVASAVGRAWRILGLDATDPLPTVASGVSIGRADRDALDVFRTDPRFRAQAFTALGGLRVWQRPRFVWLSWRMAREVRR